MSDYGRGVAACADIRDQLGKMATRIPVIWDPHPKGPAPVHGVTIATPNRREAVNFAPGIAGDGLGRDVERARHLRRLWGSRHVVVTRGGQGVALIGDDAAPPLVLPAHDVASGDVCGAGDRFAGALAMLLASGVMPSSAVPQAILVASDFVAGRTDRAAWTANPFPVPRDALEAIATTRARGGTVVATGGCFDLLHRGHVTLLQQARQLGDCLIVCMNSDASVTRLKGRPRPLVTAEDRVGVLEALACVDAVLVFDEDTPVEALARIQPDVYVKGGDYALGDLPERDIVERAGGQVMLLPYLGGRSTTSLLDRAARDHDAAR